MLNGLKHKSLYVKTRVVAIGMCYNPALVRDEPVGSPASVKRVYYLTLKTHFQSVRSNKTADWYVTPIYRKYIALRTMGKRYEIVTTCMKMCFLYNHFWYLLRSAGLRDLEMHRRMVSE